MFIWLWPFNALSQQIEATAAIDSQYIQVGLGFQLKLSINRSLPSTAVNLDVLKSDFTVGFPSVSRQQFSINGTNSYKTQWSVVLTPLRTGQFTIPAIDIGGHKTQPINIKVSPVGASNRSNQLIELESTIDNNTLYLGQTTVYTTRIYLYAGLETGELEPPRAEGVEINQWGEDKSYQKVINGRAAQVIERRYKITPIKTGVIRLEGTEFYGSARQRSQGRFGSYLSTPINTQSKSLTLNVKEKPTNYQGEHWIPTSKLTLDQSFEPEAQSTIKVGTPLTQTITLTIANVVQDNFPHLKFPQPEGTRLYEEKPTYSTDAQGVTKMTQKLVFIPQQAGTLTLEGLSLNWWNTNTGQPDITELPTTQFTVEPSTEYISTTPAPSVAESPPKHAAGIWPWLTLGVTLLWLFTLAYCYYLYHHRKPTTPDKPSQPAPQKSHYEALLDAVAQENIIQIQANYHLWRHTFTVCGHPLQQQIEQQIEQLVKGHYSPNTATQRSFEKDKLIQMLKKLHRQQVKQQSASPLAPLEPNTHRQS